ncbi:unnamed protein product [Blepharisma stoltei]|uniref:GAIN-B domain-containing protein n=1 Tax=Blepharisma stoltei TaxID=1481888 RepID=A0AAU9ITX4_9CILI|nr:unnamed protein product [Blepharisma stoltei]
MLTLLVLYIFLLIMLANSQEIFQKSREGLIEWENDFVISPSSETYLENSLNSTSQPAVMDRVLLSCFKGCSTCSTSSFDGCLSCNSGYYLIGGMCLTSCPTGWPPSSGSCIQASNNIFDFTFNQIQGYFDFPNYDLYMICGSNPIKFYPDYDNDDPYPAIASGYYFNPISSYMQMPPNSWSKDDFILNSNHTLLIWLWRNSQTSFDVDYVLQKMARDGSEQYHLTISPTSLEYAFMIYGKSGSSYTNSLIKLSFDISDPTAQWQAYAITFGYYTGTYTASYFENNIKKDIKSSSNPGWSFQWFPETQFLVGYVSDSMLGLDGWIGEISIYSSILSWGDISATYGTSCSTCGSLNLCPVSTSACFSTCGLSSYQTGSICGDCSASCTQPCAYADRCTLCGSECASYCSGYTNSDCQYFSCTGCLTCSGPEFYKCLSCETKYLLKGLCVDKCPGKNSNQPSTGGAECDSSPGYDLILQSIGYTLPDSTGNYLFVPSQTSGPGYDPIPVYKRGFYFNGATSYIYTSLSGRLRFDIEHTQSFWLKTQSSDTQTLLCKQDFATTSVNLHLQLVNLQLYTRIQLSDQTNTALVENTLSSVTITQDTWQFLVVIFRFIKGSTYWQACIFSACSGFTKIGDGYFYDIIGFAYYGVTFLGNVKSDYFNGFIYEMTYDTGAWSTYAVSQKYQTTCNGGCNTCPKGGQCLVDCAWNEYYDDNAVSCMACLSSCQNGCTNGDNCNLCTITGCQTCSKFTTCDECYAGTVRNDNECICIDGKIWNSKTNTCDNPCFKSCSTCSTANMDQCLSCNSGYSYYNGFCVPNCPIGYSIDVGSCTTNNPSMLVTNWEFTKATNTVDDVISSYPIYMGASDSYYPTYDTNDPWILPYRGLYFGGKSVATLNVPSNSQATRISLGLSHTIDIWTMVYSSTSNGQIFGFYLLDSSLVEISALQYNSTHFYFHAVYTLQKLDNSGWDTLTADSSYYAYSTWQRLVLSYSYTNGKSTAMLFVNTNLEKSLSIDSYCFYDDYSYIASLGKTSSNLYGYIYSLRLYNYAMDSVSSWTSSCGYPYCADDNSKLINCVYLGYYDESSKTCKSCDTSCTNGCIRGKVSCSLNQDPLCDTYTGVTPEDCTACISNAYNAPPCKCNSGFVYDSTTETCMCKTGYQYMNGNCVACERFLQPSELTGYFTATFVRIVVDLAISVNTTNLACEKVFASDTIAKFGSGYVCYFDSQAKKITVDLGDRFTLTNEIIKITNGALKGMNPQCGYFPYDLSTTLTYSASLPYPSARIDAPGAVLYNCQDLHISGSKSTGGVKSSLYYKWTIISDPSLATLSKYNTAFQQTTSEFTISRSDLSNSAITITLTVKNKFNNENSASVTVTSINDGLSVNFDKSIDYQAVATDFKAYAIGSISSCSSYNNLSLKWKLVSTEGNFSAINEQAIWGSQTGDSLINIPQKSIPPYTNATFAVEAADSALSMQGSNTIDISIIPAPPIVEFSRTNGSADIGSSLSINANSSYDPNEDKTLNFEWSCTQGNSDCSSLIPDVKASNLNIPSNTLQTGKEYQFELAAVADFSTRRQLRDDRFLSSRSTQTKEIVTISTVSYSTPTLTILNPLTQSQPSVVTANTMVLFQAKINGDTQNQYTYQWSVDNTNTIKFSTPLTQLFISIDEGTLETRHTYTLTLSVYDGTNYSYFNYVFYVNSPPYSGTLTVTPTSGTELETVFKMEALGWVDDESNLPISYSFGYLTGSNDAYLNFKNQSTTYFSTFPYVGSSLTVFVDVYDSLRASSRKTSSISISVNTNLDQEGLFSNYTNYVNSIASNPQSYPGVISALCTSILNRDYWLAGNFKVPSSASLSFYENVVESTLSWTEKLIKNSQFDSQSVSVFSNLLSMITFNPYLNSSNTESRVCEMIISIFGNIPISQMLQRQQPYKYFTATSQAHLYNSTSIVTNKVDLENAVEALNSIENLVLAQMVLSEIRNITVSNLGITMTVMALSDMNGYTFVSSNGKASITFPTDFSTKMATITDEDFVNLALSVFDCPNNPNNLSSSVVDFTMYGHTSNQEITANLTTSNILVQIPVWNIKYSNYTPQCVFLDTKTMNWSTEGCTRYKINSYDIICSCNHFTTFAALNAASSTLVDSNIGDTVNAAAWSKINSSNAIGLYFCIVTLAVYGIFGYFAYKKDRKEELEEEKLRRKLMGDPLKLEKISTRWGKNDGIDEALNNKTEKKKCWPCKKAQQNSNYEDVYSAPKEVFVYTFPSDMSGDDTVNKDDKNTLIKRWFQILLEKHELLNIMFAKVPQRPSFSRLTLFFLGLLGQMFFIGMFYQDTKSSDDTITTNSTNTTESTNSDDNSSSDSPIDYSWSDFWIMVWSSLFMIVITMVLNYFLQEKLIDIHMTALQYKTVLRRNKIKRWIGIILAWGIIFYFCWSIALYAIQFKQSVSKTWVLNTGISYSVNIFFTSIVKAAAVSFIVMKLMDFYEKYKLKKYRENNELDSEEDTADTPNSAGERGSAREVKDS